MKKMLSILGSIGLVATASSAVVSCSIFGDKVADEIIIGDVIDEYPDDFQGYRPGTKIDKYKSGKEIVSVNTTDVQASMTLYSKDDGYYDFKTGKVKGYDPSKTVYGCFGHKKFVNIEESKPQDYNKNWYF